MPSFTRPAAKRTLLVLFILSAVAGAWYFSTRDRPLAGAQISVTLTCDVRGRLVPCGCFTGQMGGLTRIATMLGSQREKGDIRVDAGDALEGPEDYHVIELGYIHKAFGAMGYHALNAGWREAALSKSELQNLAASSPVPFLSANLLDRATGRPFLRESVIVKKDGWRIGIVGVLDESIPSDQLGDGLRVERMSTVIGQLLPALKKDADFLILVAFTNQQSLVALAKEFPEFILVLGGRVTEPAPEPLREGHTGILYVTNESKALGRLKMKLDRPNEASLISGDVSLVHDKVPEAGEIRALAEEYRKVIRATKLRIDDLKGLAADLVPGVKGNTGFAGSDSCADCHAPATAVWKKTLHSHAFRTLEQRGADADPNCIGCHTVGFGKEGGYRREFGKEKLVDVGCESCHGPAQKHIDRVKAGDLEGARMRKLGAADCIKCHHGEFSRPFDWNEFWPHVKH